VSASFKRSKISRLGRTGWLNIAVFTAMALMMIVSFGKAGADSLLVPRWLLVAVLILDAWAFLGRSSHLRFAWIPAAAICAITVLSRMPAQARLGWLPVQACAAGLIMRALLANNEALALKYGFK